MHAGRRNTSRRLPAHVREHSCQRPAVGRVVPKGGWQLSPDQFGQFLSLRKQDLQHRRTLALWTVVLRRFEFNSEPAKSRRATFAESSFFAPAPKVFCHWTERNSRRRFGRSLPRPANLRAYPLDD